MSKYDNTPDNPANLADPFPEEPPQAQSKPDPDGPRNTIPSQYLVRGLRTILEDFAVQYNRMTPLRHTQQYDYYADRMWRASVQALRDTTMAEVFGMFNMYQEKDRT